MEDHGDKKKSSAKKQAEYVRFMFLTVTIGVILCLIVFFAVFISINKKDVSVATKEPTLQSTLFKESNTSEETSITVDNLIGSTCVIMDVIKDDNKIKLYDFEQDKDLSLIMEAGAEMKNQYGDSLILSEFKKGDIVEVKYNSNKMKFESLKISSQAWVQNSASNLKLNANESKITVGNKTYNYTTRLTSTYNGEDYSVLNLDAMDVVNLKGYNNTIWSIEVISSHGFLNIIGKNHIKEGAIEVDTNIYRALEEDGKIKVKEGDHKLVVKGSNIEPYTKQFSVSHNETVEIDLSDVPVKTGVVIVNANVSDYTLYVNDEIHISSEPLILEYGTYDIKLTKEDYLDFSAKISIESDMYTLNVNMEEVEKAKFGKVTINTGEIEGANVYVDNAHIGITPLNIKLNYGEHKVIVKKEGYNDFSLDIIVDDDHDNQNLSITLTPIIVTPTTASATDSEATTSESTTASFNQTEATTEQSTQSSTVEGGEVDIKPIY